MRTTDSSTIIELLANNPNYVVSQGILRQKIIYSPTQNQTSDAFGFKWKKRQTYESDAVQQASRDWLLERYSLPGHDLRVLTKGRTLLDAGCGSGYSSLLLFGNLLKECHYIGVDISSAVDTAAQRFAERGMPGEFLQASLMELPDELGHFDIIFSEGALHHTDSTERALRYLASRLKQGGLFLFYVYRKKGPIREYTDDMIRERIAHLTDAEAWRALEPLSKLGKALGDLNIELNIEEAIDVLEIPAGRINLHRLFYWHVLKAYHRPDWRLDELNHTNFDWYRPQNCHRQTPDQVRTWVENSNLHILKMDVQESGITVIAKKY